MKIFEKKFAKFIINLRLKAADFCLFYSHSGELRRCEKQYVKHICLHNPSVLLELTGAAG